MSDFPSGFAAATTPLPADKFDAKSAEAIRALADKGYEVHTGLTPAYADAITTMAEEPAIKEYCPRDSAERFTDHAATEKWLSKGRAVFLLLKRTDGGLQLAGYGWAGALTSEHTPGGQTTFAIRIGEIAHGQGLATPFNWLIVAGAAVLYGARDIWLETWGSNGAAVHIYHKIGAEQVAEVSGQRPCPDGTSVADTRLYMTLPNGLLPRPA